MNTKKPVNTSIRTIGDVRKLICFYRFWEIDLILEKAHESIIKRHGPYRRRGQTQRPGRYYKK